MKISKQTLILDTNLLCSPVLTPQIVGGLLPLGVVTEKESVIPKTNFTNLN